MLRNKTQTCWIYSLYRPWKRAIGPVLIPGPFYMSPVRTLNNCHRALHWDGPGISKKIKMIESERASERAGGPARKQEYVVVKKKKTIDLFNYGII